MANEILPAGVGDLIAGEVMAAEFLMLLADRDGHRFSVGFRARGNHRTEALGSKFLSDCTTDAPTHKAFSWDWMVARALNHRFALSLHVIVSLPNLLRKISLKSLSPWPVIRAVISGLRNALHI